MSGRNEEGRGNKSFSNSSGELGMPSDHIFLLTV